MSSFLTFIALLSLVDLLFSLPYGVIISILCLTVNNRKSGNNTLSDFYNEKSATLYSTLSQL